MRSGFQKDEIQKEIQHLKRSEVLSNNVNQNQVSTFQTSIFHLKLDNLKDV